MSVGFDIGNENSFIAAVKAGGIEVLDNEYSFRFTPSYVTFNDNSRDVGTAAKARAVANLENTVFGFKKLLGRKYEDSDLQEELTYFPHSVCELPFGDIAIKVNYLKNDVTFSITQIMAMLLTKLKQITEIKLGNTIRECVISVPVYYSDAQRRAMLDAAHIANLNVLKLMNESTAVALAYGFYKIELSQKSRNVILIDFGNSCITVTACAFSKEKFEVLACVWDEVGGRDFDNKLVEYFAHEFKKNYELDVMSSKKAVLTLIFECELLKKKMSANPLELGIQIECFMQDKDVKGRMKRELFENLSANILHRVENILHSILDAAGLKRDDVHAAEIVGGSSRMPIFKSLIKKVFGCEPSATLNQDEAVVRGCALQCALLSPSLKTKEFMIYDKPTYCIKITWKNKYSITEEMEVFSHNDKVPGFKLITMTMSKPFNIEAFFCSLFLPSKVNKIGTFTLANIPQDLSMDYTEFKIRACYNIHGIFLITKAKLVVRNVADQKNAEGENKKIDTSEYKSTSNTQEEENALCPVYDLTVTSDVHELPKFELDKYKELEQQMIRTDVKQKEQADARNALEEYIYDVKAKLHYEFKEFVQEETKTKLSHYLDEIENWLLDNEDAEVTEYSRKLTEVKKQFDPIITRYVEWGKRPSIISEFRQVLQTSLVALNEFSQQEKITVLKNEEFENLRKIWQDSKSYLDQALDTFSTLEKYDDASFKTDEMRKALENFQNDFQTEHSNLLKKIKNTEESTESSNGFGDLLE